MYVVNSSTKNLSRGSSVIVVAVGVQQPIDAG